MPTSAGDRRPSKAGWRPWSAGLVLAVMAGTLGCAGPAQDSAAMISGAPSGSAVASSRPAPAALRATPVTVRIPRIGVNAFVGQLGLNPDQTVQVPRRPQDAGWYRLGPAPGQSGSAVILGHIDSKTGPAVFYRLRSLRKGDRIDVELSDGVIAHFAVDRVETYPNAEFPARQVSGPHGYAGLQLVTCGGRYDHKAQEYTANFVAYTSLLSTTPAP